jgi:hypothetical protein
MQLRLPSELKARIAKIAQKNHLSEADVVRLCLAQAIPSMEKYGLTLLPVAPVQESLPVHPIVLLSQGLNPPQDGKVTAGHGNHDGDGKASSLVPTLPVSRAPRKRK